MGTVASVVFTLVLWTSPDAGCVCVVATVTRVCGEHGGADIGGCRIKWPCWNSCWMDLIGEAETKHTLD